MTILILSKNAWLWRRRFVLFRLVELSRLLLFSSALEFSTLHQSVPAVEATSSAVQIYIMEEVYSGFKKFVKLSNINSKTSRYPFFIRSQ